MYGLNACGIDIMTATAKPKDIELVCDFTQALRNLMNGVFVTQAQKVVR